MPYSEKIKKQYIKQLTDKEKKAMAIAIDHLGSSFSLEKSLGFIKWIKKNSK